MSVYRLKASCAHIKGLSLNVTLEGGKDVHEIVTVCDKGVGGG